MKKLKELLTWVQRKKVNSFDNSRHFHTMKNDKILEKGKALAFLQMEEEIKEILKSK